MAIPPSAHPIDMGCLLSKREEAPPPPAQRVWRLVAADGSTTCLADQPMAASPSTAKAPAIEGHKGGVGMPRFQAGIDDLFGRPIATPPREPQGVAAIRPAGHGQATNPQLAQVIQMWSDLPPPIQRAVVAMVRSAVASKKPAAANGKARSAIPAKGPAIAPTAPLREPSLAAVAPHRIAKTAGR